MVYLDIICKKRSQEGRFESTIRWTQQSFPGLSHIVKKHVDYSISINTGRPLWDISCNSNQRKAQRKKKKMRSKDACDTNEWIGHSLAWAKSTHIYWTLYLAFARSFRRWSRMDASGIVQGKGDSGQTSRISAARLGVSAMYQASTNIVPMIQPHVHDINSSRFLTALWRSVPVSLDPLF